MALDLALAAASTAEPVIPAGLVRALLAAGHLPPFCRGVLRKQVAHAILSVSGAPLKVEFRGAVFAIHDDAHTIENTILLYPRYNSAEFAFLLDGLPAGGIAVDLGSNIGLYSLPLAVKAGPAGQVLAIDASAHFASKLAVNARLSGISNVIQEIVAVGDHNGQVSINIVEGNAGTAVIGQAHGANQVEMRPLLDVVKAHGIDKIDVMKVDIDGSEEIALVPFLRDADPALLPMRIVMEHIMINAASDALPRALAKAGYTANGATRVNTLYERQA